MLELLKMAVGVVFLLVLVKVAFDWLEWRYRKAMAGRNRSHVRRDAQRL